MIRLRKPCKSGTHGSSPILIAAPLSDETSLRLPRRDKDGAPSESILRFFFATYCQL